MARGLYKLMAYKDEYEVARLSIDPAVRRRVAEQFGAGSSFAYRLHPPVLRALGMKRKISLGQWSRPVFRLLYAARRLRGSRADFSATPGMGGKMMQRPVYDLASLLSLTRSFAWPQPDGSRKRMEGSAWCSSARRTSP